MPWLVRYGYAKKLKDGRYHLNEVYDHLTRPHIKVPDRFKYTGTASQFIKRQGKTYDSIIFRPAVRTPKAFLSGPVLLPRRDSAEFADSRDDFSSLRIDNRGGVVRVQRSRTARKFSERNRRRHDRKVYGRYAAFLSVVNKTYGRYSEWNEFSDAIGGTIMSGGTLLDMAEALLINEAIDRLYGARMGLLKRFVYSHPLYTLPIGVDALSNFWRHW